MARIAIMALEGMEEVQEEVETSIPVEEIPEQPEQDMLEMQEVGADADEVVDAVDDSADTADTLEVISERMEETLPEGGMDEKSAEVVRVAVEAMVTRLGFPAKRASFAMEGFADKTTRVRSTKIALEGIKETVKAIWQAIVSAFKRAFEIVKSFFAKFFTTTEKLKARAEKIKAAAAAKKGNKEVLDVKVTAAMTMYMRNGNEVADGAQLVSIANKVKSVEPVLGSLSTIAEEMTKKAATIMSDAANNKDAWEKGLKTFANGEGTPSPKSGMCMKVSMDAKENLLYKDVGVYLIPKDSTNEKIVELAPKIAIFMEKPSDYKDIAVTGTIKGLTAEQAITVADAMITLINFYEKSKDFSKKLEAAIDNVSREAKKLESQALKNENTDSVKRIKDSSKLVRPLLNLSVAGLKTSVGADINMINTVLNFCASSVGSASVGSAKVEAPKGDGSDPALGAPAKK